MPWYIPNPIATDFILQIPTRLNENGLDQFKHPVKYFFFWKHNLITLLNYKLGYKNNRGKLVRGKKPFPTDVKNIIEQYNGIYLYKIASLLICTDHFNRDYYFIAGKSFRKWFLKPINLFKYCNFNKKSLQDIDHLSKYGIHLIVHEPNKYYFLYGGILCNTVLCETRNGGVLLNHVETKKLMWQYSKQMVCSIKTPNRSRSRSPSSLLPHFFFTDSKYFCTKCHQIDCKLFTCDVCKCNECQHIPCQIQYEYLWNTAITSKKNDWYKIKVKYPCPKTLFYFETLYVCNTCLNNLGINGIRNMLRKAQKCDCKNCNIIMYKPVKYKG